MSASVVNEGELVHLLILELVDLLILFVPPLATFDVPRSPHRP